MTDNIFIGRFGPKRWLAATNKAPYFCLEAESEKALYAKLKKLFIFIPKALEHFQGEAATQPQSFETKKKISREELEAA
jgi:hypothetical protein